MERKRTEVICSLKGVSMQALAINKTKEIIKDVLLIAIFTGLMALSSYIKISLIFSPVPITLQTFILFLSIACLRQKASLPQIFYILLGVCGLPVFSKGGAGLLYLLGPTGGYIVGFFVSAFAAGVLLSTFIRRKVVHFIHLVFIFTFANGIVYFFGMYGLIFNCRFSFPDALMLGVVPFVVGDAYKIVVASAITYKLVRRC